MRYGGGYYATRARRDISRHKNIRLAAGELSESRRLLRDVTGRSQHDGHLRWMPQISSPGVLGVGRK